MDKRTLANERRERQRWFALEGGPGQLLPAGGDGPHEPTGQPCHCDLERRVIEIGVMSEDDDALDVLLIHEVAHAVASPGHGKV